MEDASVEEAVIVRYLLGDLPEETLVEVEDRAFSDPEYLRLIEAVEADLIDAYVHNQLEGREQRQFEERFLASAERRKKVDFARALAKVTSETKAAPVKAAFSQRSWTRWFSSLRPAPAFQFAMAAVAVVLLAAVSWQVIQTASLRNRVRDLEAERNRQQQREQTLQSALDAERARTEALNAQIQQRGGGGVASLTLLAGMVRDQTARPQIAIPPSAQLARLEIQLEPRDKYPWFRAVLATSHGNEVMTQGNLHEQSVHGGRVVVLDIPAQALSQGEYELTLQGVTSSKHFEDIAYHHFSVRK